MNSSELPVLHRSLTVVDGHCDIPLMINRLADARGSTPALYETSLGKSIRAGAVDVVICPSYAELEFLPEGSLRRALQSFVRMEQAVARSAEQFAIVRTCAELKAAVTSGRTALILGLEGCTPLGHDPEMLETFVRLGARVIGLTWNERNPFASGAKQPDGEGLTPLGRALVRTGDRLGVTFDVSHLNERTFWDVMETGTRPVVASHSNCRALFDHGRNITDDQIKAIAQRGGVVSLMIQSFVLSKAIAGVDDLLRHVNHAVDLVGVEHVGFGYDFIEFIGGLDLMKMDYLPPERPPAENAHKVVREIPTHEQLPVLTEALLRRGYSEADVGRLMGGNWLDFLTQSLP